MNTKHVKNIVGVAVIVLLLASIIWIARPVSQKNSQANLGVSSGVLTAAESAFDFGEISMAAGKVNHQFKIVNSGAEAVTIGKMYTSCMCTTAALKVGDKKLGPYGMQGHGFIPKINQTINPSQEAIVEVVFDPAAHGPAGVGRISRTIYLENNAGDPLELEIAATVTP